MKSIFFFYEREDEECNLLMNKAANNIISTVILCFNVDRCHAVAKYKISVDFFTHANNSFISFLFILINCV